MADDLATAWVAAGSAFVGVVLSQAAELLKAYLDKKHQRQDLYRQKFESLVLEIDGCSEVLTRLVVEDQALPSELVAKTALAAADKARRARTLACLYFPGLVADCDRFLQSCLVLVNDFSTQKVDKAFEAAFLAHARDFNSDRSAMEKAIIENAGRHI
ncbi:hypothetical protein [Thiothrix lacustris]|uniref:hypothetical protein n=1 Tax=Thiothrix lacustris TaxID=525917 RepID=UPI00048F9AD2|nr:hypothetical protein [Thiothrix lacustris]